MIKKIVFLILFFYLLVLLQTSFLVHFFSFAPNLALIIIVIINLIEDRKDNLGVWSAVIGGFFLDVFSQHFFGFYILSCFFISLFIKLVFKNVFSLNEGL